MSEDLWTRYFPHDVGKFQVIDNTYTPHNVTVNLWTYIDHERQRFLGHSLAHGHGAQGWWMMKSGATFQGSKDVSIFWQPRRHFLCWFGSNNIFRLQIDSKFDKLLFGTCARAFLVTTWPIIARYNLAVGMLRDTLARYTFKSTKTHKINDPDALASTWLGTPFHSFHGFVFLAWFYVVHMPLYSTSAQGPYGCCRWLQGPPPSTDLIWVIFADGWRLVGLAWTKQSILLCRKRQSPSKKGWTIRTAEKSMLAQFWDLLSVIRAFQLEVLHFLSMARSVKIPFIATPIMWRWPPWRHDQFQLNIFIPCMVDSSQIEISHAVTLWLWLT